MILAPRLLSKLSVMATAVQQGQLTRATGCSGELLCCGPGEVVAVVAGFEQLQ
jgi:hypothetical protein